MADTPRLSTARTPAEICEAVSRFEWHEVHGGKCPPDMLATEAALADWLPMDCPAAARKEAEDSLTTVMLAMAQAGHNMPFPDYSWRAEAAKQDQEHDVGHMQDFLPAIPADWHAGGGVLFARTGIGVLDLSQVHASWLSIPEAQRPAHSLAAIVRAWQARPPVIRPETRRDKRLLPTVRASSHESRPERRTAMLFGGITDDPERELPIFEAWTPSRKSVAILDLCDSAGLPVMSRGPGIPMPTRLFFRAGIIVPPEDRIRERTRLALRVTELMDGLYPRGWKISRDWPRVLPALQTADSYWIPLPDGGLWRMLALRRLPSFDRRDLPALDDTVVMDLAMPPGTRDSGPEVDLAALDALSLRSGPSWRASIAAHTLNWIPGRTQRPVPGHPGRWGWSRAPSDYPVFTQPDRRRLAFGANDQKHRTRRQIDDAWRELPGLVVAERQVDPDTGEVGWRILPAEIAPPEDSRS